MFRKKIVLTFVILCLSTVVLQSLIVIKNSLFDLVTCSQRNLTNNHVTDSQQDRYLSDLREFASALHKQKEWMKLLLQRKHKSIFPKVDAVNCTKIWENDEQELSAARKYQQTHGRQPGRGVRHYSQKTANCTSYLVNEGFLLASVDEDELSFPLAYSLVVYVNLEQVERLLRAVYRPHNVYCIHPDNKSSDDFHSSLRFIAGCLPNVNIVERPLTVKWGTYSVLQADVEYMRLLWRHPVRWRYFINLTGQEFPLKTNNEIVRILQTYNGANDITGERMVSGRWKKFLPAPHRLSVCLGSVHILASRGYVDYVINSPVARDFYKWVGLTFIPDETFFSTLNYNLQLGVPGSYTGTVNDKSREHFQRLKVWLYEVKNTTGVCDGRRVRGICQFGVGDISRIVVSPHLFANKFSYNDMPLAYDCIEEWYWHKVHMENVGQAPQQNLTRYKMAKIVQNRYDGPVKIWESE